MIGYVTVGTNDLEKSVAYYDELLGSLGASRALETDRLVAWSVAPNMPMFCACKPYDGNAATVGNGVMIAFAVDSADKVDALYNKAMELGSADEGAPGERMDGFYACYFRDPDGNKLNAFHWGA